MSNPRPPTTEKSPSILFFGMRCAFSLPPLAALLGGGVEVRGVVLPAADPETGPEHAIDLLAREAGVPVVAVADLRGPDVVPALAPFAPDAIVVACFPWRLPGRVRALAPLGGLNVHPSLLPELRGPEPVFWALRRGVGRTGTTLHRLDAGLDTGPIVAQTGIAVPPGVRAPDLEARLAGLGAGLLVPALRDLAAGTATGVPQDDARATDAPVPAAADWLVPTNLPAGWAYAFARGVAPLGGPLALLVLATGERVPIREAVAVDPAAGLGAPIVRDGALATARFRPGTVTFLVGP